MPIMQVTLDSLKDIGGGIVSAAFLHELKRAVIDCHDRPGDKNARTVAMEMKLSPVIQPDGTCDEVAAEFRIKSKVPERKSKTFSFGVRKGGVLVHNPDSSESIDQQTLLGE